MQLLPELLKLTINNLTDLDNFIPSSKSFLKIHLHLDIAESLAERLPLSFNGNAQELKWKVMELVKVPIEEVLYAYESTGQKLFLLNKKIWQEHIQKIDSHFFEIEKVTLAENIIYGLELPEPTLNYSQIKKGFKLLSGICLVLSLSFLVLNLFFKNPDYQTLGTLKETTQNLKNNLNQIIETEKEQALLKEKNLLHKQWLKAFKNLPLQLPAWIKLSEINIDETGQLMQLKGESKNQALLQSWAKQVPGFELTQVQMQSSPNTSYQFIASIRYQSKE
jgi:hypothetical protein